MFDIVRCIERLSTEGTLLLTVPARTLGLAGAKASTEFGGDVDRSLSASASASPASLCRLWIARRKVVRRATMGECVFPEPRLSLCHSSSADRCDLFDLADLLLLALLMLLSSSTIACSKSRAIEEDWCIGGKSSWSMVGLVDRSGLSALLSGLSALAMLASVPRRLPWYGSLIVGRLSGWLRWSSRSGSGVLYLV